MTKAKVFCAVAILDRSEPLMEQSLFQACTSSKLANVGVYRQMGDSYIMRVRNHAATAFLDDYKDFDYYAQWSADIEVVTPNVFDRLINHNVSFIGGVYAPSGEGPIKCTSVAVDQRPIRLNTGLREIQWLSGGLWLAKRSVLERMREQYPDLWHNGDGPFTGRRVYDFFSGDVSERGRKFLTEDYWFCQRWRDMGGAIWADTDIRIRHWGKKGFELE